MPIGTMAAWVGDVLAELAVVVGGVVVLLYALAARRDRQDRAAWLALGVTAIALGLSVPGLLEPGRAIFAGTYVRDHAAAIARVIILLATAVTIVLSVPWFRRDARHGEYYALLLYAALGAMLLAGATALSELVVAMLLSSATGFVLSAYHRRSAAAAEAAIKYYLIGALANGAMLMGVAILYGLAGGTTLDALSAGLSPGAAPVEAVAVALVMAGLMFKLGGVPLHAWVPDVAQGAPAPVAGFLTAVPKVGAFVFLARFVLALPGPALGWASMVAVGAAATMTLGNLACLWQGDVRRLLGWSSVSQTGYGLMAVAAMGRSDLATTALLYFLAAYVPANLAAFGVVVTLRGRTALADYAGLADQHQTASAALAISFLSFIGVPPLAGFVAKLLLFVVAIQAGFAWLAVVAAVNTVISIFYYVRVIAPVYFAPALSRVRTLGGGTGLVTAASAAALVIAGVAAEPLVAAFAGAALGR
ncbi:MAG: NADH-quinone oxidoreductase subunit N [Candidatus Limnocylindrales bacterium]